MNKANNHEALAVRLETYVKQRYVASGGTQYPTVRNAAKALKVRQRDIAEVADELPFMLTSFDGRPIGDHYIELPDFDPYRREPLSDRELLERAAKAIGHEMVPEGQRLPIALEAGDPRQVPWNPLLRDADAMELVVQLNMTVDVGNTSVAVWLDGKQGDDLRPGRYALVAYTGHGEKKGAVRRAITQAAAGEFVSGALAQVRADSVTTA